MGIEHVEHARQRVNCNLSHMTNVSTNQGVGGKKQVSVRTHDLAEDLIQRN